MTAPAGSCVHEDPAAGHDRIELKAMPSARLPGEVWCWSHRTWELTTDANGNTPTAVTETMR